MQRENNTMGGTVAPTLESVACSDVASALAAGTPCVTPRREQIKDLDVLPHLDRGLIDYRRYHEHVGQSGIRNCFTIQGSRGCPYRCVYCDVSKIYPRLRQRSPQNIFEEVSHLYSLGARQIEFIDDIFNIKRKEFIEFFRIVIDSGLKIGFHFQSGLRGDILDPEAIDVMVAGGVRSVNVALETASPRLQELMRKNLDIEKLERNIHYMVEQYPHVVLGLNAMHGFPTETEEEAISTIEFVKKIKWLHFAQLHNVRIFPGSVIEQIALENGVTRQQIAESLTMPYNAIPTTFHFDHEFSRKLRLDFVHSYVLNRERLRYVLQKQLEVCTADELIFKYKTYFPSQINSIDDILRLARIKPGELDFSRQPQEVTTEIRYPAPRERKPMRADGDRPLRVLYLDASQFFSTEEKSELRIVEPPLGALSLVSHLHATFGDRVEGKIAKSFIDFDSFEEAIAIVEAFKPDLIGVRTMSYYKDFFRDVITAVRSRFPDIPIIAGGPHPTIAYTEVLEQNQIQAVVLGEGELTNAEIVEMMLENGHRFPTAAQMSAVGGVAFLPERLQ